MYGEMRKQEEGRISPVHKFHVTKGMIAINLVRYLVVGRSQVCVDLPSISNSRRMTRLLGWLPQSLILGSARFGTSIEKWIGSVSHRPAYLFESGTVYSLASCSISEGRYTIPTCRTLSTLSGTN